MTFLSLLLFQDRMFSLRYFLHTKIFGTNFRPYWMRLFRYCLCLAFESSSNRSLKYSRPCFFLLACTNMTWLTWVSLHQGLYSVLAACQYPQLDRLTPDSLDWLFEVSWPHFVMFTFLCLARLSCMWIVNFLLNKVADQCSGSEINNFGSGSSNGKSRISDPDPDPGSGSFCELVMVKKVYNFG